VIYPRRVASSASRNPLYSATPVDLFVRQGFVLAGLSCAIGALFVSESLLPLHCYYTGQWWDTVCASLIAPLTADAPVSGSDLSFKWCKDQSVSGYKLQKLLGLINRILYPTSY